MRPLPAAAINAVAPAPPINQNNVQSRTGHSTASVFAVIHDSDSSPSEKGSASLSEAWLLVCTLWFYMGAGTNFDLCQPLDQSLTKTLYA